MKDNVSSRGCKGLSGRLVTVSRSAVPHSLSPHSFAVCWSTLSPNHRVAGHQQRRSCVQAGGLRLACHCDPFCQSSGSARSSRSHLMTWAACWSGESAGKALDTVLTSPALWGPLYSLIPDYWAAFKQAATHAAEGGCSGRHSDTTCVRVCALGLCFNDMLPMKIL